MCKMAVPHKRREMKEQLEKERRKREPLSIKAEGH